MADREGRRSSRSKKEIDYAAFGDGDDCDDDFANPTPPIAKKPRDNKEKSKKPKKKKSVEDLDEDYDEFKETSRGKRKERKPVEDRMFDRELELVLEMSRGDSSQESTPPTENITKKKAKEVSAIVHIEPQISASTTDSQENQAPLPAPQSPPRKLPTSAPLKRDRSPSSKPNHPAQIKRIKSPPSKSKAPAPGPPKRTSALTKMGVTKKVSATSTPKAKSSSSLTSPRTVAIKRPAVQASPASGNNPLGGVKLVSPGAPIRLGLSKFARIKPLHSSAKV